MLKKSKKGPSQNPASEIRYRMTSKEWIVVAPTRARRYKKEQLIKKHSARVIQNTKDCPFEHPQNSGNEYPYFWYPNNKSLSKWTLQVFRNKYPALTHEKHDCTTPLRHGIYKYIEGRGYHDLLITRSHTDNFSDLSDSESLDVLNALAQRYRDIAKDKCVKYISIFQNWGPSAGASVFHPHYQILALPMIPSEVKNSLDASRKFFKEHKKYLNCQIIEEEKKVKKRVIYENRRAIAFIPYAAKRAFQVGIFPKPHLPYFEETPSEYMADVAKVLKKVLQLVKKNLADPDYNFFLHTAPVYKKTLHKHYHWHIEVMPKSSIDGGFELGTGVEINPVMPERAALLLRTGK